MNVITTHGKKLTRLRSIFCTMLVVLITCTGCTSTVPDVPSDSPNVSTAIPEYHEVKVEVVSDEVGTTVKSQYDAIKDHAHMIAENARALGLSEDDPSILYAQQIWNSANEHYERSVDILATVVYNEAWGGCNTRHRELVAAVVVNRLLDDGHDFGPVNTIEEVVCQRNQYNPSYADPDSIHSQNARRDPEIWETCRQIAIKALAGEVDCPANVLFQSQHIQGDIYEIHDTSYSRTYFCYG